MVENHEGHSSELRGRVLLRMFGEYSASYAGLQSLHELRILFRFNPRIQIPVSCKSGAAGQERNRDPGVSKHSIYLQELGTKTKQDSRWTLQTRVSVPTWMYTMHTLDARNNGVLLSDIVLCSPEFR